MVFEKLRDILAEQLEAEPDSITLETDIANDLGADSLDVVELAMTVEDEFNVVIPDEAIEGLKTVADVVDFIEANK